MSQLPAIDLPDVMEYPTNGYDGSYYQTGFYVPTYNPTSMEVFNMTSWADIDVMMAGSADSFITQAACLGLCLTTFIYVLVLTPSKKRGKPFHICLLLALAFQMLRFFCEIIPASRPGWSLHSAYLILTNDRQATTWSAGYIANLILALISSCLAFLFTSICLYIQSAGLLKVIEIKHPRIFVPIMAYLVTATAVAFAWRITYSGYQIADILGAVTSYREILFQQATLITYSISIASWSLVSLISVITLLITRRKLVLGKNATWLQSAFKLIGVVCIESLILPLIFCILQLIPSDNIGLMRPEHIIIPSVLVILPLGSLFVTVHTANLAAPKPLHLDNNPHQQHRALDFPDKRNGTSQADSLTLLNSPNTIGLGQMALSEPGLAVMGGKVGKSVSTAFERELDEMRRVGPVVKREDSFV